MAARQTSAAMAINNSHSTTVAPSWRGAVGLLTQAVGEPGAPQPLGYTMKPVSVETPGLESTPLATSVDPSLP